MRDVLKGFEVLCLSIAAIGLGLALFAAGAGHTSVWQTSLVIATLALAMGLGRITSLRTFRFTAWVVAAVTMAMLYPQPFQPYATNSVAYKWLLLLLIQAVMFGMGTQISLRDFSGVAKQPWPVAIGLLCQFTIMPLVGYGLALAFRLPPEIGAGMVLIGSCSSGLASNVMAYLARANLALSISLTAVATLLAPLVTPSWMKLLAGSLLEGTSVNVSFTRMMVGIIKIVVVPIGAALIHDYLKHASPTGRTTVRGFAALAMVALMVNLLGGWSWLMAHASNDMRLGCELTLFLLGGIAFGFLYHEATQRLPSLDAVMPRVAMFGIVYVTGMTTAEGRENLLVVGTALMAAAALHNLLGYLLGYWASRAFGLDRLSARTVAFEVGMQNGGMATGLAAEMGRLGTLGLPAAFFIAWMNVSGSMLANLWRRRPVLQEDDPAA